MLGGIVIYFHRVNAAFLRIVFLYKLTWTCDLSFSYWQHEVRNCEYSQYNIYHSYFSRIKTNDGCTNHNVRG